MIKSEPLWKFKQNQHRLTTKSTLCGVLIFFTGLVFGQSPKKATPAFKPYLFEPKDLAFYYADNQDETIYDSLTTFPGVVLECDTDTWEPNPVSLYLDLKNQGWVFVSIGEYNRVKMDTINLDKKGNPEIILNCLLESRGSGSSSAEAIIMIIARDSVPRCLLTVNNYCMFETFPRVYDTYSVSECYYEASRDVKFSRQTIRISPAIKSKNKTSGDCGCDLGIIPPGYYRLINGKIRRVK